MGTPQVADGGLEPGQIVDRYQIDAVLGRGGMAVVYRVKHLQLGSWHALKILTLPGAGLRERLLQEGRLQASLQHPNIVSVTDVLDFGGAPALVMEYVDGPTLDQWLGTHKPTFEEVDAIFRAIVAGVAAAHDRGLVHRDLKPANVLMMPTPGGVIPKVADFGLAKALAEDSSLKQTRSGVTMGTPQYMAPEQIRDAKNVDSRADVFSLGCILYELVAGHPPFQGEDLLAIFNNVAQGRYRPLQELVPDAPPRYVAAISGCLEVDREKRLPSCGALFEVFGGASVSGFVPLARPSASLPGPLSTGGNATFVTDGPLESGTPAPTLAPSKPEPTATPAGSRVTGKRVAVAALGGGLTLGALIVVGLVLLAVVLGVGGWLAWRSHRLNVQVAAASAYDLSAASAALHGGGVRLEDVAIGGPGALHADVVLVAGDGTDGQARRIDVSGLGGAFAWDAGVSTWTRLKESPLAAKQLRVGPADLVLKTSGGDLGVAFESLELSDAVTGRAGLSAASMQVDGLVLTVDAPVFSAKSIAADSAGVWRVEGAEWFVRTRTDGLVEWPPILASVAPAWLGGNAGSEPFYGIAAGRMPVPPTRVDFTNGSVHVVDRANAVGSTTWDLVNAQGSLGPAAADGRVPFAFTGRTHEAAVALDGHLAADGLARASLAVHDLPVGAFAPYVEASARRYKVALDQGRFDGRVELSILPNGWYDGTFTGSLADVSLRADGAPKATAAKLVRRDEVSVARTYKGDLYDWSFAPTNGSLHAIADALFEQVGDAEWATRSTAPVARRAASSDRPAAGVVDPVAPLPGADLEPPVALEAPPPTDDAEPPPEDPATRTTTAEQIDKAKAQVDKLNKGVRDAWNDKRLPLPGR